MIDFRAPDGTRPEFMFTTTAYSFSLPAGHSVSVSAAPNGAWEQCALIYMGDQQLNVQLGSDERPVTHVIDPQPYPVQITVTGWHKEGGPDPDLPWFASQGSHSPGILRWRDNPSGPFDDLEGRIFIQLGPWYRSSDSLSASPHAYQASTPLRALQIASWILYFSTLAEPDRCGIDCSRRLET